MIECINWQQKGIHRFYIDAYNYIRKKGFYEKRLNVLYAPMHHMQVFKCSGQYCLISKFSKFCIFIIDIIKSIALGFSLCKYVL